MTEALIIVAVVAYLAVGLVYARLSAVRTWRAASRHQFYTREDIQFSVWVASICRTLAWPLAIPFEILRAILGIVLRHLTGFVMRPVTTLEDRIRQLRDDARSWEEKARSADGTPEERQMARELASVLYERARDLKY